MSLNRITVVDCGVSGVALGTFSLSGGSLCCDFQAAETLPVSVDENWLQAVITALPSLAAKAGELTPVVIVLPPHTVLLKHLKTPRVAAAKRDQIVKFEVAQNIPYALDEVVWSTAVTGEQDQETDLLLAAAKLEMVEPLCRAAAEAGFEVKGVLPSALAVRAAEQLVASTGAEQRLVLSVGSRTTTFLQIDGSRFAIRSLAMGGNALVASPAEAASGEKVAPLPERPEPVDAWVIRLAQEAKRSILHFQRQNNLASPISVRLAGEGLRQPDLPARVKACLNLPVERLDLTPAVRFAPGVSADIAGAAWENLVGAAARELHSSAGEMNLLPASVRRSAALRQRRPWLIATAACFAASLLLPALHYRQVAAATRADLAAIDLSLAPLQAREVRNRAKLEEITALTRETMQLHSLDDRRTGWIRLFADLQERFTAVEDVWLENLQTIAPSGNAPMKLAVSGRMLDRTNPLAKVSPETVQRVQALLEGLAGSPFVAAVEGERFDNSRPGILKFDFVLVTNPARPL